MTHGRSGSTAMLERGAELPADLDAWPIEDLCIATIRTLAMDAVQKAGSGHPGTPMGLAPAAFVLWDRFLRHDPAAPEWFDRDRFLLSNGHASMLQYALLHLTGYDLSLEELRRFRQWGSRTPGHPEAHLTPGIETTTGPLGQGVMNSVGMAIAEAHLAEVFNRPGHGVVDHRTWAFCSDGDLMEGASHEAASLAGHLALGRLTWLYDDNHITIEGDTALAYSEDVPARFEAYGWHVQDLGERANDVDALHSALEAAGRETDRPSLIVVRSHIAWGAPGKQDTAEAHGSPLGEEEVRATKRFYGWPEEPPFLVPERVRAHMGRARERGAALRRKWREGLDAYRREHPELADRFEQALEGGLPEGWDEDLPSFDPSERASMATRAASGTVLNAIGPRLPWLVGGSADLADSNKTLVKEAGHFSAEDRAGRNLHWGVREHVMVSASSGMAAHGGVRPYAATFLIFTDYARPGIRLAALMGLPVVYVMTHDSIGLGEDGPTHQPVEHLASLRAMPGLWVLRPADANETTEAWRVALERTQGPSLLALTRQDVPVLDRSDLAGAEGLRRGGYVLARERGGTPDLVIMASGSEVTVALEARELLAEHDVDARVVSLPCWELFRAQPDEYRRQVLPPAVRHRVAVEAAASFGWREWVGDEGLVVGVDRYGASAPWRDIYEHYGITPHEVATRALAAYAEQHASGGRTRA